MKKLTKLLSALGIIMMFQACETQKIVVNREVDTQEYGKMLLGPQKKEQLLKEPYADWYDKGYQDYNLDQDALKQLKKLKLNSYSMVVFLGTWCEDSHEQIPRLMKVLETLKYPESKLTLIAVNAKKESPSGEEGLYNIQNVPTIILKKYGKEVGRMVEYPKTGVVEKDLVQILEKDKTSLKDLF